MSCLFPWETPEIVEDYFSGPCLFMALYRLYKGAYFGQGFHLSGIYLGNKEFKNSIDQLPLDIKRIILGKIWNQGKAFRGIVVKTGKLHLVLQLHFLFVQFGKLKHIVKPRVPRVYAGWTGHQIVRKFYIFTYGPVAPSHTPLIPEFMCSEKRHPLSPSFSLICP